jgi:hypothetical protein
MPGSSPLSLCERCNRRSHTAAFVERPDQSSRGEIPLDERRPASATALSAIAAWITAAESLICKPRSQSMSENPVLCSHDRYVGEVLSKEVDMS